MSTLVADSSPRSWWFSSNKSGKDSRRLSEKSQESSNGTLRSLASVFGLKTKKHPSLAIQDPPPVAVYSMQPSAPPSLIHLQIRQPNRPPSKSVSSTIRSSLDTNRDPFVLTLSDPDPFASQGI